MIGASHPLAARFGDASRWCNWRLVARPKGKPTKRPIVRGRVADVTMGDGLMTFAEAMRADSKHIGITLGSVGGGMHLVGFDRDDCIVDGALSPDAQAFAAQANTYAEVSPSGAGVKFWLLTDSPLPSRTDKRIGREFYSGGRYFTVTGRALGDVRDVRIVSGTELARLVSLAFGDDKPEPAPATKARTHAPVASPEATGDDLADALAFVADWRADDRREWLRVGMAIKASRGDAGRELWRAFSQRSAKYDADTFDKVWQSLKPSRCTVATVFYMAREDGGWRPPSRARDKTRALIVQAMHGLRAMDMPEHLAVRDERIERGAINGAPITRLLPELRVSRGTVFAVADAVLAYGWNMGHTKGLCLSIRRIADLASVDKKQAWAAYVAIRRLGWLKQASGYCRPRDMDKPIAFDLTLERLAKVGTEGDIYIQDVVEGSCNQQPSCTDMSPSVPCSQALPFGRMRMIAARGMWQLLGPTARRICEVLDAGEHTAVELASLTHYTRRAVDKALARLSEFRLIEHGRDGWALVYDFDLRANALCDDNHGKRRTPAQRAWARRHRHATESARFKGVMDIWRVERALADEPGAPEAVDAMGGERIDLAILAIWQAEFKRTNRARDWRAGVEASTLKREAIEGWSKIHAEHKDGRRPKT